MKIDLIISLSWLIYSWTKVKGELTEVNLKKPSHFGRLTVDYNRWQFINTVERCVSQELDTAKNVSAVLPGQVVETGIPCYLDGPHLSPVTLLVRFQNKNSFLIMSLR